MPRSIFRDLFSIDILLRWSIFLPLGRILLGFPHLTEVLSYTTISVEGLHTDHARVALLGRPDASWSYRPEATWGRMSLETLARIRVLRIAGVPKKMFIDQNDRFLYQTQCQILLAERGEQTYF